MNCPNCGRDVPPPLRYCIGCGSDIPEADPFARPGPGVEDTPSVRPVLPESRTGNWRKLEKPLDFATVTMSVTCDHCAQPVPVNGPARRVNCANCLKDTPLSRVPEELALAAQGYQTLGSPYRSRTFDTAEPQCRKCGSTVPVDGYLDREGATGTIDCPQCGTGLPTYPAPAWMKEELPTVRQVFGGDPEVAQAEANLSLSLDQEAIAPVLMACPQCSGSLTITPETPRTMSCSFCGVQVFLPDALWSRMHPAKVMQRWTVSFSGELKTREDLEEQEREREQRHHESDDWHAQTPVPSKSSGGAGRIWTIGSIVLGIGFVFFMVFFVGKGCSRAEGTLTASGPPVGDRSYTVVKCKSGQRQGFRGVMLIDESDSIVIRVVEDPVKGTMVGVQKKETCSGSRCEFVMFDKEECPVFDVNIENTSTTVNDIRVLSGHLNLDCAFKEGGTVKAAITFKCD